MQKASPPVNAAFPSNSRFAEVEVKAVADRVKDPPIAILAGPPEKTPKDASPETETALPPA